MLGMLRIFLILGFLFGPIPALAQETSPTLRSVEKVPDGGTLVLNGGEVVRLIGIEAPKKPRDGKPNSASMGWWRQSEEFTESMVKGRKVWLEYGKVPKDEQGHTWAYVFFQVASGESLGGGGAKVLLTPGTYMLNRLILRYGMASSGNPFPFKYRAQFKQLEHDARNSQIGLFQQAF